VRWGSVRGHIGTVILMMFAHRVNFTLPIDFVRELRSSGLQAVSKLEKSSQELVRIPN
jgi:hypothetical protein